MVNKSGFKIIIKKVLLIYSMLILLPISLYIVIFVFPQVPMMTFGYQYDLSYGNSFSHIDVRFSGSTTYLAFNDWYGIHAFKSEDSGYSWTDMFNGSFAYESRELIMDVYENTIGLIYDNRSLSQRFFIYSNNKGINWSIPSKIPVDYSTFAFINSTYLIGCSKNWTVGSPIYNTTIYLSRDSGLNWEVQTVIPSYIQYLPRFNSRVTQNQTIYLYGISTTDTQKYSIYRSADLGKTWIEIETDFPGGRLLKGNDDSFYIVYYESDYTIKLYKSTDDCINWFLVENSGMNRNYIGPPYIEINENDKIFVIYVKELPKIALPMFSFHGLDYFWVGRDIWTGRYVSFFFAFFLPAAAVGLIVAVAIYGLYSLYTWDKREMDALREQARNPIKDKQGSTML